MFFAENERLFGFVGKNGDNSFCDLLQFGGSGVRDGH